MAVNGVVMIIRWSIVIVVKIFGFIRHDEEQRASDQTKRRARRFSKKKKEKDKSLKKERKKERRPTFYVYDFLVGLNLVIDFWVFLYLYRLKTIYCLIYFAK